MNLLHNHRFGFLAVLMMALMGVTHTGALGIEYSEIIVQFNNGVLDAAPTIFNGNVVIFSGGQKRTMTQFHDVASITIIIPRGWKAYDLDGPYLCQIENVSDKSAYMESLKNDPDIAFVDSNDRIENLLGEDSLPWYPDIQQQLQWCKQNHLNSLDTGEADYVGCGLPVEPEWYGEDIDAPQAWGISLGSSEVVVAVIDVGFGWNLPDLGGDGPPVQVSLQDSIYSYTNGVLYCNWDDPQGDLSNDGYPGIEWVDDDGDGFIDENVIGLDRRNQAEPDVWCSTFGSISGNTFTDPNANFVPGALEGFYFYNLSGLDDPATYFLGITGQALSIVESNTSNSFTLAPPGEGLAWENFWLLAIWCGRNQHEAWAI